MSKETLEFHVKSDDYFGTLATVLDLLKQHVFEGAESPERKTIENKVKELLFLQNNYKIVKKNGSKSSNKEYRPVHNQEKSTLGLS
jgi:hypothetical protein